jgi:hypothetical protein
MTVLFEEVKKVTVVPLPWLEPWEAVGNPLLSVVRMIPARSAVGTSRGTVLCRIFRPRMMKNPGPRVSATKPMQAVIIEVKGGFNSASRT